MRGGFTIAELLSALFIMGVVIVVSMQSVKYVNHIHQENEIRYLALNRADSEMSRLVMAYENFTNFTDSNTTGRYNGNNATNSGDYGLLIGTAGVNFVQIKNVKYNNSVVEEGDFVGILYWYAKVGDGEANITLSIRYPYIFKSNMELPPRLWDYNETIKLQTSTKVR